MEEVTGSNPVASTRVFQESLHFKYYLHNPIKIISNDHL